MVSLMAKEKKNSFLADYYTKEGTSYRVPSCRNNYREVNQMEVTGLVSYFHI